MFLHPDWSPDYTSRPTRVIKPIYEALEDFWVNPVWSESVWLPSDDKFSINKRVRDSDGAYRNYECAMTYAEWEDHHRKKKPCAA